VLLNKRKIYSWITSSRLLAPAKCEETVQEIMESKMVNCDVNIVTRVDNKQVAVNLLGHINC